MTSETGNKFRSMVENSSEAILLLNSSLELIYANSATAQITGRTDKEYRGKGWIAFIHPEDMEQLKLTLGKVQVNTGDPYTISFRVRHRNSNYIWLEGSFKNLLNDPVVNAIVCNFRDVTERKNIEEQRALYEFIINSSDDAIISKDLDGIITSWNKGAEKIFGYTANEVIGKHISLIIPEHRINEDVFMLNRIKQGFRVNHYETERITKDGRLIYISQLVSPILDSRGKIIGASKISRDITGQKAMKDKLIESESIYHAIAANLPGSIVTVVDRNRRFILAEGQGMATFGYTAASFVGKKEVEVLTDEEYEHIREFREKAFAGVATARYLKLDNRYYHIQYIPLRNEMNEVYAVMTLTLDVTDVKKAEEEIKALNESLERKVAERTLQLEDANRELEAFSYSVSHDLRAPLRIINGYADILHDEYANELDAEGKRIISVIMNNTHQMGILIDALLNLSRLGRKELSMRDTDMNKILSVVIDDEMTHCDSRVQFIKNNIGHSVCDETLIRYVWGNLISNAVKYSANVNQPVVEIGNEKKGNETIYWVKDNGIGFDMAYGHKLFGVFQRLHKKTEFEGTGIGLALVQRIISRHGGRVWADAEVGKGATFYFSLPALNQ